MLQVNKQLTELTHLELQYASPPLLKARDFGNNQRPSARLPTLMVFFVCLAELAVPGTYRAASGVVNHIAYFEPSLKVIESKQRPRKLSIRGSGAPADVPRVCRRLISCFGLQTAWSTNSC